jgi:integrase/recombinase XerD
MIEVLFTWKRVVLDQQRAPLREERAQYLAALTIQGVRKARVRSTASLLLHIVRLLRLQELRPVHLEEIHRAAEKWLTDPLAHATRQPGNTSLYSFTNAATKWFKFHGMLVCPSPSKPAYQLYLDDYTQFLVSERQFALSTVRHYSESAAAFVDWAHHRGPSLTNVTASDIDEYLAAKQRGGWNLETLSSQCRSLRAFLRYTAARGWTDVQLVQGIQSPRLPAYHPLPKGPKWRDVRRLIHSCDGKAPTDLRAKAIVTLCSIYGLRSCEIAGLMLDDLDWLRESFTIKRAKRGRIQQFPLQYEVGEAILGYVRNARPHCAHRSLFLTLKTPYRPINSGVVWDIVSTRMLKLGIASPRRAPHSLRHSCATELLRNGSSMREIADFLGQRDLRSVGIYAKSDMRALRRVASFSVAGVL